jgi:hypothetical protein
MSHKKLLLLHSLYKKKKLLACKTMTLERERHIVNQEFVFVPENLIRPTQETTEALRQFIVRTNQFAAADWRYCTQFVQDLRLGLKHHSMHCISFTEKFESLCGLSLEGFGRLSGKSTISLLSESLFGIRSSYFSIMSNTLLSNLLIASFFACFNRAYLSSKEKLLKTTSSLWSSKLYASAKVSRKTRIHNLASLFNFSLFSEIKYFSIKLLDESVKQMYFTSSERESSVPCGGTVRR